MERDITTLNSYEPDYAVHPGEYLEEVLEAREIKKREFAERVGLSVKAVSQIINGKALYSPEAALRFERVLGINAAIWSTMAKSYELFKAREEEERRLQAAEVAAWVRRFPTADLKRLGILPDTRRADQLAEALFRFFGVSGIEAWEEYSAGKAALYRQSAKHPVSREAVEVWLTLAEREAEGIETDQFDKKRFTEALSEIRSFTLLPPEEFFPRMVELLARTGVALVVVPELKGTRISGAARWLSPGRALISLSLRYKSNDQFWFSFFHEAAHILLHGKRIFIDQKDGSDDGEDDTKEAEANEFAGNLLIPRAEYRRFIAAGSFYEGDIRSFAEKISLHPGIVVGRLQHDGLLDYKFQNGLKEGFEYAYPDDEESN
ncbi:HigA family addiction module antitoxin [Marispirochaeta sp.]|uniref:HigA family addiction module antitoxin n=1 Tax=Marispirochaeta sp. TaxID=2038653 RepID=UPI0029C72B77|nr:HigA family addiction module antitoxin [Marispirochaeta sp.]